MSHSRYNTVEAQLNRELFSRASIQVKFKTRRAHAGRIVGLPTIADLMFIVDMGSWTQLSIVQNLWQWSTIDRVYVRARQVEIIFGCKIFIRVEMDQHLPPIRRFSYHGTLILELAKRLLTNYASLVIDMEAIGHSVREMYGKSTKGVYTHVPEVYDLRRMPLIDEIMQSFVNPCFKEKVMAKAKSAVHQTPVDPTTGEASGEAAPVTEATASDAPPRKAPRQAFRVDHFVYVQEPTGKLAAQAQIILNHIRAAGPNGIGKKALVEALAKDPTFVTRQPVERVLTYYQRPLIDANLVVSTAAANDSTPAEATPEVAAASAAA